MHRPDEDRPERRLEIELRNGPAIEPMLVDKQDGRWVETRPQLGERLVRKDIGDKLDAERVRKHDVILGILLDEAAEGRLYTVTAVRRELREQRPGSAARTRSATGSACWRPRASSSSSAMARLSACRPRDPSFGYLCVEGMVFPTGEETVDPDDGRGHAEHVAGPAEHLQMPPERSRAAGREPHVWVYPEGDKAGSRSEPSLAGLRIRQVGEVGKIVPNYLRRRRAGFATSHAANKLGRLPTTTPSAPRWAAISCAIQIG